MNAKEKYLKIFFAIVFAGPLLNSFLIDDNVKYSNALLDKKIEVCLEIKNEFIKRKCFRDYVEVEINECKSFEHKHLCSSEGQEAKANYKPQTWSVLFWGIVLLFNGWFSFICMRFVFGDMNLWFLKPLERIKKLEGLLLFIKYRNENDGEFFLRIMISTSVFILYLIVFNLIF